MSKGIWNTGHGQSLHQNEAKIGIFRLSAIDDCNQCPMPTWWLSLRKLIAVTPNLNSQHSQPCEEGVFYDIGRCNLFFS